MYTWMYAAHKNVKLKDEELVEKCNGETHKLELSFGLPLPVVRGIM